MDTAEHGPERADTGPYLLESDPRPASPQKGYSRLTFLPQPGHSLQQIFLPNLMFHLYVLYTSFMKFCKYTLHNQNLRLFERTIFNLEFKIQAPHADKNRKVVLRLH